MEQKQQRFSIGYFILAFVVLLMIQSYFATPHTQTITYSQFKNLVQKGLIENVAIGENIIHGTVRRLLGLGLVVRVFSVGTVADQFAPSAREMAISRGREYGADATGASISGDPLGLANALRKLQRGVEKIPMEANPATAHMFIVSPLTGGGLMTLFSTHPPLEERIARLESMAERRLGVRRA